MPTLREWKNGPAHRSVPSAKTSVRSPFNARARRALPVLLQRSGSGRDRAIANVVLVAWDKPRLAQTTAADPEPPSKAMSKAAIEGVIWPVL